MTKRALRVYKIVAAAQQTRRKKDDFMKEYVNAFSYEIQFFSFKYCYYYYTRTSRCSLFRCRSKLSLSLLSFISWFKMIFLFEPTEHSFLSSLVLATDRFRWCRLRINRLFLKARCSPSRRNICRYLLLLLLLLAPLPLLVFQKTKIDLIKNRLKRFVLPAHSFVEFILPRVLREWISSGHESIHRISSFILLKVILVVLFRRKELPFFR